MVRCPLSICLCTPIQCARQHNPAPCPRGPQPRNDCRCCRPPCMALHPAWPGPQTPTPTGSRPDWLGKSEASDTPRLRQRAFLPPVARASGIRKRVAHASVFSHTSRFWHLCVPKGAEMTSPRGGETFAPLPAGFRRLLWPPLSEHYQQLCLLTCVCNHCWGK